MCYAGAIIAVFARVDLKERNFHAHQATNRVSQCVAVPTRRSPASLRRFKQAQTRASALEVAQAAWALHERLWHDQGCNPPDIGQFRAELFKECPELRLMRDHAETGKHVELSRQGVELISITGAENPGGVWEISDPFGQRTVPGQCTLEYVTHGKSYKVTDVLERVVRFWVDKLR
jgi:hypothetical protein